MLHKQTVQNILWKLRKEWIGDSQPLVMNQTQLSIRLFITDLSNDIDKQPDDPLPTPAPVEVKVPDFIPESLAEMEQRHIMAMLKYKNWNKSESARMLGIERSTLDRKLKKYGIERPA